MMMMKNTRGMQISTHAKDDETDENNTHEYERYEETSKVFCGHVLLEDHRIASVVNDSFRPHSLMLL
jgi:hypothetical protein